jgi:hypothetical protein
VRRRRSPIAPRRRDPRPGPARTLACSGEITFPAQTLHEGARATLPAALGVARVATAAGGSSRLGDGRRADGPLAISSRQLPSGALPADSTRGDRLPAPDRGTLHAYHPHLSRRPCGAPHRDGLDARGRRRRRAREAVPRRPQDLCDEAPLCPPAVRAPSAPPAGEPWPPSHTRRQPHARWHPRPLLPDRPPRHPHRHRHRRPPPRARP